LSVGLRGGRARAAVAAAIAALVAAFAAWFAIGFGELRSALLEGALCFAIGFLTYRLARARQRAADRVKFIEDLFESVPAALGMRDTEGRYMYVNRTWEQMFRADRANVLGRHVSELIPKEEAEALVATDRAALARGVGTFLDRQEIIFRGRHMSQARSVMTDADGKPVGVVIANIDTTDHFILQQTLATQAKQLELQNEALKENVRLREDVERVGRHDLKTPLSSILSVPRLLREGGAQLTREQLDLLDIIERAGYRILNMVNLSLDLFKMEQGTYRFNPHPVDLLDVVGKVLVDVTSHAESKNVVLRTVVNGRASTLQAPVYAWGDELLCYSIFGNLVKNAIEAAPEGECVTISIDGPRDGVTARIHNPGAVPDSVRDSFFEKYASSGKSEGTGLGTYSARLMARTQGGDMSMRTSAQAGTTIEIRLQAAPESALPASREARAEQQPASLAAPGPIRVLVVDDDEFNRLIVRRYLPPPAVVDTAVNGRAAGEAAAANPPDAILMDLDMPIMDGYEAVFHIRGEEGRTGRKRAVVIALSSHDDEETRARCLTSGFDYYLTKPVTRELLRQTLARLCSAEAPPAQEMAEVRVDDDVRDMIPQFLASRRELASELSIALGEGDRERLRRTAHKLSGSFALYGMRWAADHCRALELDAASGDVSRLGDMIARLRAHLDAIRLSA